jgi:4-amino-4-deoxy-L-arabinose transferase-like glycosyltransferase
VKNESRRVRDANCFTTSTGLLLILLIGCALRFYALGARSFWLDEAYTWGIVVKTDWLTVWPAMLAITDVSPLSYVITKLLVPVFGSDEFGLRLTSAFFGLLAIPVIYRIGWSMFNRGAGLLAAAIISLSPFAVWYSQDARPYGLYLFLSALTLWGFWRASELNKWKLLIAASALLYLTHYVGALFAYAQAVYCLSQLRSRPLLFRHWFLAQALAVLPAAAWVGTIVLRKQPMTGNGWIPPVTLTTPLQTLWNFVSADAATVSPIMMAGVLIIIVLILYGSRSWSHAVQQLLIWLGLPLLTAWLFSLRLPAYIDRFFEPALLAMALLLGAALYGLPRTWRRLSSGVALGMLLIGSLRLYSDPIFQKENWREAARIITESKATVGLLTVESQLSLSPYFTTYPPARIIIQEDDLTEAVKEDTFILVVLSSSESAHAVSKSSYYTDPISDGPELLRSWAAQHPDITYDVISLNGVALMVFK